MAGVAVDGDAASQGFYLAKGIDGQGIGELGHPASIPLCRQNARIIRVLFCFYLFILL
jgi:hypothetical protein